MDELGRIRDAARVLRQAAHPTDIMCIATGFRVMARKGNLSAGRSVTFDELETATLNPLVDAIREVNRIVS